MEFYKPEDKGYVENVIRESNIIYTSMEIGLHERVKTYSGGLGILAGDTLRSCADKHIPVSAITLLYKKGYFKQRIENGEQYEEEQPWNHKEFLIPFKEHTVTVHLDREDVHVQPWVGIIVGQDKHLVPIILLDTDIAANSDNSKYITNKLYDAGQRNRLKQEAVLGIAGKRVLKSFNPYHVHTYHMNEGHAALAPLEDTKELRKTYAYSKEDVKNLIKQTHVFTTHTPVPAGHDRFNHSLIDDVLHEEDVDWTYLRDGEHGEVNMTKLAMTMSHYINGVAKKHGEVSQNMFPEHDIDYITNGIHLPTWTHPSIQKVYDDHVPGWRENPDLLQDVEMRVSPDDVWNAHMEAKRDLIQHVHERTGEQLDEDKLIIGFARRFATYKRATLMFQDLERFKNLSRGKIQVVFAGKAHPADRAGKDLIKRIHEVKEELQGDVNIVFVEDYDIDLGKHLVSGCDIWQNNPVPPKEASGTSGMKAVANGVPNLSVLDGWWIEGVLKEPDSGWIIHQTGEPQSNLYRQYEDIIQSYYEEPDVFKQKMMKSMKLAAYFNTHRMVDEYSDKAWNT